MWKHTNIQYITFKNGDMGHDNLSILQGYMIISKFDRATFAVLEIDRASEQDQPFSPACNAKAGPAFSFAICCENGAMGCVNGQKYRDPHDPYS